MEIHHIVPRSEGGKDTEENGIPLCFDCHAEVAAYNPRHPKGRCFSQSELRKHKEQWFAICKRPPWNSTLGRTTDRSLEIPIINDDIFNDLRVDDRRPAEKIVGAIMRQDEPVRKELVKYVLEELHSDDEDTRWKFSYVVEELVLWEPRLVPAEVIEEMSQESFFSVRSSAAVCYYYLAKIDPAAIPLRVLSRLAAYDEDWYVATPATGALLRLARARPVVIDILARDLDHEDAYAREHAAANIRRLAKRDWDLISSELVEHMLHSSDSFVREIGQEISKQRETLSEQVEDYPMF
jgi:hypothetical protein